MPDLVIFGGVVGRFSRCWRVRGGGGAPSEHHHQSNRFLCCALVMLGFGISDRTNAIAGALIFAVSEVGVRSPTVSGGCV